MSNKHFMQPLVQFKYHVRRKVSLWSMSTERAKSLHWRIRKYTQRYQFRSPSKQIFQIVLKRNAKWHHSAC